MSGMVQSISTNLSLTINDGLWIMKCLILIGLWCEGYAYTLGNILLVAVTKKAMHITRADAKQVVTIYNAVGTRLQQIKTGKYSD